jgi:hypothetical protein
VLLNGAIFSGIAIGNTALTPGTTFTAIDNTASHPIRGTFSNLADDGTTTIDSNTFQANYEGGDGNDLTLTRRAVRRDRGGGGHKPDIGGMATFFFLPRGEMV